MRVTELTLENIQSYDRETIRFDDGATLIYGQNGAGKSTLFRGIFGGLFQSQATTEIGSAFTLDNFVRHGADGGRIELTFEANGNEHTVEWELGVSDEEGTRSAKTESCTLRSTGLDEPVAGVQAVRRLVTENLVGMSARSFVSSAYVQQGDIARLVHASESERTAILDGLLGLDHVDDLIDRAVEARREAKSRRNDVGGRLSEAEDHAESLPGTDTVRSWITQYEDDIETLEDDIAGYEADIDDIDGKLDGWREQLENVEEWTEKRATLEAERDEKRTEYDNHGEALDAAKRAKRDAEERIDARQREIARLDGEVERFEVGSAEASESALATIQDELGEATTTRTETETRLENQRTALSGLEDQRDDLEAEIRELQDERENLATEQERKRERRTELATEIRETRHRVALAHRAVVREADSLPVDASVSLTALRDQEIPGALADAAEEREQLGSRRGKLKMKGTQLVDLGETEICPVCGGEHADGRTADGRTVEHALDDVREEIAAIEGERDALTDREDALDALRESVGDVLDLRDRLESLEDDHEDVDTELDGIAEDIADYTDEIRETEADLDALETEIGDEEDALEALETDLRDANERVRELTSLEATIEQAIERYDAIEVCRDEIEQAEQRKAHEKELRRNLLDGIDRVEDDLREVEDKLDGTDVETIEANIETHEGYREKAVEQKKQAVAERNEKQGKLGAARDKLDDIERANARVESLRDQQSWIGGLVAETNDLIDAYEEVKARLRAENVELLNAYTNDLFADLYQNQSYTGVAIDGGYDIELVTTDGERVAPEATSGGESTVVNLALRAGVYRLVAERGGTGGETLPPFILDEPTTYLDDAHVGELQSVIEIITDWNVPQVLVVSHDDQLIDNADALLHVEKEPTTNTSRVTRTHMDAVEAGEVAEVSSDDD